MTRRLVLAAALALAATPAAAQHADPGEPTQPGMGVRLRPRALVSVNALGLVSGRGGGVEGELRLNRWITVGAGVGSTRLTHFRPSGPSGQDVAVADRDYLHAEAKARVYLLGTAPAGLSVGLTGGRAMEQGMLRRQDPFTGSRWTSGVSLDYNWLVGPNDRLLIGTGLGYRQYHHRGLGEDVVQGSSAGLRLSVGYAF